MSRFHIGEIHAPPLQKVPARFCHVRAYSPGHLSLSCQAGDFSPAAEGRCSPTPLEDGCAGRRCDRGGRLASRWLGHDVRGGRSPLLVDPHQVMCGLPYRPARVSSGPSPGATQQERAGVPPPDVRMPALPSRRHWCSWPRREFRLRRTPPRRNPTDQTRPAPSGCRRQSLLPALPEPRPGSR